MNLGEDVARIFQKIILDAVKRRKTEEVEIDDYLRGLNQMFGKIKTLLYYNEPKPIYEFYIPNDIFAPSDYMKTNRLSPDIFLTFRKKYIVITGMGGLGKTMLMHHLLLTLTKKYEIYKKLPIAIQLKDYDADAGLMSYIESTIKISGLKDYLKTGKCVFLLDGMDEISTKRLKNFEKELDELVNTYPDNMYILSSRPISDLIALNKFEVYTLAPFTKGQALALIDKGQQFI